MHSHYYAFDIHKEKFLHRTFIKLKEFYNPKGVLVRKDSLAPPEQGYYYEKYFDVDGKKRKVITYEFKGNYQPSIKPDSDVFLPNDFEKKTIYSFDKNGEVAYQYRKKELLRYVVHQRGDVYDITDRLFKGEFRDYENNKYITFEPLKNHVEIKIMNPSNDSVLCTLKYKYTNGFLNSTDPDEIREFIIKNATAYATVPYIKLYDNRLRKSYILNYNFERIIDEPVESCRALTRASNHADYFWVCNKKCGLYSARGKNIIPLEHGAHIEGAGDFLKISTTNGQYACVDYEGNVIIPQLSKEEDFTIYSDNVASIYRRDFSSQRRAVVHLNLLTGDTLQTYDMDNTNRFASDEWMIIKSSRVVTDYQIIQDSLAFLELKNPKYYDITGPDRKFWHQKWVLKLPDSLQEKTDLLTRYPDFDPVEYKYVLYNLKTDRGDTINVILDALEGNRSYNISLDSHSFVKDYARLEIMVGNSYSRFYSLLSYDGKIVNMQKRYTKMEDVNSHGQFIVQFKECIDPAICEKEKETYGVINANGEEIVPCEYRSCSLIKRYGYRVFADNGKYGLVDFEGELVVKPQATYNEIDRMIMKAENPFIQSMVIGLK